MDYYGSLSIIRISEGREIFEGFNEKNPLTVNEKQHIIEVSGEYDVLATITLPYTLTDTHQFSAIHSNPPGIHTELPAIIVKRVGKGKIMWLAAPIEKSRPYMSRKVVYNLLKSLFNGWKFTSNAPNFVEILGWRKNGRRYFAAINQQEAAPVSPIYDVYIEIPEKVKEAKLLESDGGISIEYIDEKSRIKLPRVDIFQIVEVET